MQREVPPRKAFSGTKKQVRLVWGMLSGGGMALGAVAAVTFFPSAAAGVNRVGDYGAHVYGFAALFGAGLGLIQACFVPTYMGLCLRPLTGVKAVTFRVAWAGATTLGGFAMLYPLWSVDLLELLFLPIFAPVMMLPGLALMGVAQAALFHIYGKTPRGWGPRTMIGGALGALVAPLAAIAVGVIAFQLSLLIGLEAEPAMHLFDVVCAGVIGSGIGWFQAGGRRSAPPSRA